jgi:hypothetical protein
MFRLVRTLLDVSTSKLGELGVPDEVLGAMKPTPVPVSTHHGVDEVRIVLVGSVVVDEVTRLDIDGGSADCRGNRESDERDDDPHAGLLV